MAGIGRVVVGYDKRDSPNRTVHGADIFGGKCISCGRDCYYNASAIDALGARDAQPVCKGCELRWPNEIREEL